MQAFASRDRSTEAGRKAPPGRSRAGSAPAQPNHNPIWQRLALGVQAKLDIGAPDDTFEREADEVADRVMRMPEPVAPMDEYSAGKEAPLGVQRRCAECEHEPQSQDEILPGKDNLRRQPAVGDDEEETLQAKPEPGGPESYVSSAAETRIRGLSGGRPLAATERAFFEPRFGRDFAGVRIHRGAEAASVARAIDARAFTKGRDIAFAAGSYGPETTEGRRLLAHELAHVVQQRGDKGAPVRRKYRLSQLQARAPAGSTGVRVSSSPSVYYYPGSSANTSDRKAFVVAGIHREERSAAALGRQVRSDLSAGTQRTDFHALVMPAANRSTLRSTLDLNRQFGGTTPSRNAIVREIPGYQVARGGANWRPFLPAVWEFLRLPPQSAPARSTPTPASRESTPTPDRRSDADVQRAVSRDGTAAGAEPGPAISRTRLGLQKEEGETRSQPPVGAQGRTGENAEEEPGPLLARLIAWIRRLLREIGRVLRQLDTMPPALPRERAPASLPSACRTFANQSELDLRKRHWEGVIAGMSTADVVQWVIGRRAPQSAAQSESRDQMDCLLHAMRASVSARGGSMPPGAAIRSGHRDFARQRGIWESKFNFTRRTPFDRISDHARASCGTLLRAGEQKWNTREPRHRVCWGVAPRPGTSAPAMPSGARALTGDERQAEILQASSAPGISRHHWGTDFDLFDPDMNPEQWEAGQPFADEYSWLFSNAGTYGFIQSFTPLSTFMRLGYMEERWHWSYYPVAQALVDFSRGHQGDIETALLAQWGTAPQFSFIRGHWREFMLNVRDRGVFPP